MDAPPKAARHSESRRRGRRRPIESPRPPPTRAFYVVHARDQGEIEQVKEEFKKLSSRWGGGGLASAIIDGCAAEGGATF
jgi:hypothetical protein